MNPEDFQDLQQSSGLRSGPEEGECPLITVLAANEHAIVVQSRRSFEPGSAVALGIHVHIPQARQTEFVSAETIVVESKPMLSDGGDLLYQVTMLFSEISHHDRDLLVLVSMDETMVAPSGDGRGTDSPSATGPGRGIQSMVSPN